MNTPSMLGGHPVERELGRGGMGVVYLARDLRLNRAVAIKVLPDALALNPEHLARFEREAKLLASLNHPNIATIFGIEEEADVGGRRLLVLEYVTGDTLAVRTARGAIPLDEALDICRQIALALEAAHEGGIIHRDLKPGNVKITPDGQVKVLDFGLAKGGSASGSGTDLSLSPTITDHHTGVGVILGTAGYMSPEQARGKTVDKRADIWAFGCVLFECLTGRQLFGGETVSDTLARILEREPDWAALPAQTPPRVREVLRRCLEKDAKRRQRDIGDVRIELEETMAARSSSARIAADTTHAPARAAAMSPRTLALAALLLFLGAAAGIGVWSVVGPGAGGARVAHGPVRLSIAIPPAISATYAGMTTDGRSVLVLGYARRPDGTQEPRARIYSRRLNDYEFKPIPGTEGAQSYTRSPDGARLAIVATVSEQSSQRRIVKVPVDGSSPLVTLADWDDDWNSSVAWLEDGDLLVASNNATKLFRVPTGGGPAKPPIPLDTGPVSGGTPALGTVLPHDRGVFFTLESWGPRGYQLDQWLLDPKTGKARRLFESAGSASYSPTGHVVFTRNEALLAAPFDLETLAITGDVTALPGDVRTPNSWAHGSFEITRDATLTFSPGGRMGTDRRLVTVDSAGTVTPFTSERRPYETPPAVSRDGRRVAVVMANAKGTFETWVADLDRAGVRRILSLPNADCASAVWSPDGQQLAYRRVARDKDDGVYVQRVDGTGSPRAVLKAESLQVDVRPISWAPDASGLIVVKTSGGKGDILFVPVSAGGEPGPPRVLRATPYDENYARFSPDGRLIALISDESGKHEVYVAGYGADGALGPLVMLSSGGGALDERRRGQLAWAGDSRRLFYYADPNKAMSATIQTLPTLSSSTPVVVHDLKKLRVSEGEWDILPDGRLLAIQKGEGEDDITVVNIVLNWFDELRERIAKGASGRGQ